MDKEQLVEEAKAYLFHIKEDIQWAFNDGFFPEGKNPYREGTSGSIPGEGSIHVGNQQRKNAYTSAVRYLNRCRCLLIPGVGGNLRAYTHISDALKLIDHVDAAILNPTINAKHLNHVVSLLYLARVRLHSSFHANDCPEQPAIIFCSVCGIREAQHSHRCHTCYVYWRRHDCKEERPKSLDKGSSPYQEALAQRKKHGVGYGYR